MEDQARIAELQQQLASLRRRVAELEAAAAEWRDGEEAPPAVSGDAHSLSGASLDPLVTIFLPGGKVSLDARLIEESPDPFVTISLDGKIAHANKAAELATGLPREHLIGSDFASYFAEPERACAVHRQAIAEGEVRDYPLTIRHVSGRTMDVLYSATVYCNKAGELLGVCGSTRDITARTLADEAVRAERQRLDEVLETLPAYVALLAPDYHVPFANRYFRERFGEPRGRRCFEFLFGRTEPCENCETYTVQKTRAPHHWEWTGPDQHTYDIFDYPFHDTDGSPLILEMGIDISERKKAEEALAEANRTLEQRVTERTAELQNEKIISESTIESLPGVFYLFDAEGRFLKWNSNFQSVTGYSVDELAQMGPADFFVGQGKRDIERAVRRVFDEGEVVVEAPFMSKDGRATPYVFTGRLAVIAGRKCLTGMGIDISERKRAEDALRTARDELDERVRERTAELHSAWQYARGLIEASLDPLVTISPEGKITDVNRATEEATGISRGRLIGSDFSDYFTEPDKARAGYQHVIAEGEVRDYPLTIWHTDGRSMDVLYNATVYRNEAGAMQGVFAAARDVTEQQKAQEVLRTASLYTRSLIEASPDPLVTISPEGKITDVNRATEEATGEPRERLIGSDFSDYFTEPENARAGYQHVIAEGEVRDYPLTIRHASGHTMDVLYNATVYRNEAGDLQGVFAAARDVTRRKKAEEVLRRASLYTRSLIEASPDPLVTISPEGKITDVNRATEEATGEARERLIGSDFSDYFTEPEKARAGYQHVIAEGKVSDYPLTIRHITGKTMDVLYNATVYRDEAGVMQGVFAAARDVTERKKAEEALQRQTQELERSNADLQQFAYVASHDLQEPLRMVASFTQLLRQRYQGKMGEEADEFIGYAVDGATRMQRMINDLLVYSRVNTRGSEPQSVSLEEALSRVRVNLNQSIEESGAVVTHDALPQVSADPTQMEQLLQNLVGNAIKFRSTERPLVHVSAQRQRGEWVIGVHDNGIGIASEYYERIFVIFQRLHTREEYTGSGIGLAVCKRIVERLGGRIWLESTPGQGSTFFFSIPGGENANGKQ